MPFFLRIQSGLKPLRKILPGAFFLDCFQYQLLLNRRLRVLHITFSRKKTLLSANPPTVTNDRRLFNLIPNRSTIFNPHNSTTISSSSFVTLPCTTMHVKFARFVEFWCNDLGTFAINFCWINEKQPREGTNRRFLPEIGGDGCYKVRWIELRIWDLEIVGGRSGLMKIVEFSRWLKL